MRKKILTLLLILGLVSIPLFIIAEENIWTLNGTGSQRDTAQVVVGAASAGSAAYIRPGVNNTNDLGTSSYLWKNLYLAGTANMTGTANITGDTTIGGDLTQSGTAYFTYSPVLGASGVALSTLTVSASEHAIRVPMYLWGTTAVTPGMVVRSTYNYAGTVLGCYVAAANAAVDVIGIADSSVSTGSVVNVITHGFALAFVADGVKTGYVMVSTVGTAGYLGVTASSLTASDLGHVVDSNNVIGSGKALILIR